MRDVKKCLGFREDLVGDVVVPYSKLVVLILGIPCIYLLSLRFILVSQFRQLFILLMKVSLALMVTLVREVIILERFIFLVMLDLMDILGQLDLLILVLVMFPILLVDTLVPIHKISLVLE